MLPGTAAIMERERVFFSVVVPTFGRTTPLGRCLGGVAALAFPRDRFEVVIVNDQPAVDLGPTVAPFADRIRIISASTAMKGPAAARNHGCGLARGSWLAFTDDDCVVAPDWLERARKAQLAAEGQALAGRVVNALTSNPYAVVNQYIYDRLFTHYNARGRTPRFAMSNNLFVPARGFAELHGFDTDFDGPGGEDREFLHRWLDSGRGLGYDEAMTVRHSQELGFSSFVKKHFVYGRGAYRYWIKKNAVPLARGERLDTFPPFRLLGGCRLGHGGAGKGWFFPLLVLSQMATLAGYLAEQGLCRRNPPP